MSAHIRPSVRWIPGCNLCEGYIFERQQKTVIAKKGNSTGKSLSEALLFAEDGEKMGKNCSGLYTTSSPRFELGIFVY